jgi:hypothetical protein
VSHSNCLFHSKGYVSCSLCILVLIIVSLFFFLLTLLFLLYCSPSLLCCSLPYCFSCHTLLGCLTTFVVMPCWCTSLSCFIIAPCYSYIMPSCFRFCALLFLLLHYSCPCFLCWFVIHALLLALPCYSSLVAFVVLLFMLSCSRLVTLALHLDVLPCLLLGLVALSSCFLPYHRTLLLCHHCPTIMPCYLAITP